MKATIVLIFILLYSSQLLAKGMIFSLGGGNWSPKAKDNSALGHYTDGKFIRIAHEGSMGGSLLYVVSAGMNTANVKSDYEYKGLATTSSVADLKSDISMIEAKLGFKYNLGTMAYLGAGGLVGNFLINYDRDDYVVKGADTANYEVSENSNYVGHYYEAGLMLIASNFGTRIGVEVNSASLQNDMKTLSSTQPVIDSSKVYLEVLWKN